MKKAIKILVIILAVALILVSGAFLFWKFGTQTGQIGEQVFYTYIKPTKTIVIHGQGEMWDYWESSVSEWSYNPEEPTRFGRGRCSPLTYYYADEARKVVILDGVTFLSAGFLGDCDTLEAVYIPKSVVEISLDAFEGDQPNLKKICFEGDCPQTIPYLSQDPKGGIFAPEGDFGWGIFTENWIYNHVSTEDRPVIYYQPGTTGWEDPMWDGFRMVERKYRIDWS